MKWYGMVYDMKLPQRHLPSIFQFLHVQTSNMKINSIRNFYEQ